MELPQYSGDGTCIVASVNGREVIVSRPYGGAYGHQALEILTTLVCARNADADVFFIRPSRTANAALFDLEADQVRILRPGLFQRLRLYCKFYMHQIKTKVVMSFRLWRMQARLGAARELKFHTANKNFSKEVRAHLRGRLKDLNSRKDDPRQLAGRNTVYYKRLLLQEPINTRFRSEVHQATKQEAESIGIYPNMKLVAIHARTSGFKAGIDLQDVGSTRDDSLRNTYIESYFEAIDYLVSEGYTVVRIGDSSMRRIDRTGVIDLATSSHRTSALEVFVLLKSKFLLVGDSGPHLVSYLTNTPLLMVNATDPLLVYPVRKTGMYLLQTVIDLDTGRSLGLSDLLTDDYYGSIRSSTRFGYRPNTSDEIVMAVKEMVQHLQSPAPETLSQTLYRQAVLNASETIKDKFARKWTVDRGVLGDGRPVRFYADRWF